MLGGIKLITVVLLTFQLIYGTVSSNQVKVVSDLKELVERIQNIANTNGQDLPETREESHFGSLNKQLDGATNNRPIDNINEDSKIFFNHFSDILKKGKNSPLDVPAVSDDEIVPRGSSFMDAKPGSKKSEYDVFEVDKDIEFLKELELYPNPKFNMYNEVVDNKKKQDQRDPTNEKGDDENDAYWVNKEDPQNYAQQGPTVLEQLLKQKKKLDNDHKHHKKKTYLKPNDLTGYAGLFDLNKKYDQPENDFQAKANKPEDFKNPWEDYFQAKANQPGDFKSPLENYNTFQDQNNLQSNSLDKHVPSDLKFEKHTDTRSSIDGLNLDKYSKVYVILNPQALIKPKPKSKVSQLVSDILSNLLKNKDAASDELKYRDYLRQSRRRRRSLNMEQIDLSNSDGDSGNDVSDYQPKRKPAPLPHRPKPFKVESSGSGSEDGGSYPLPNRPKPFKVGSSGSGPEGGGSALGGRGRPKAGFGGGQKFGDGNKGFKAIGGKSKGNLGSRNLGSSGGSFGGNKGSKGRGGRNRGGGGLARSGGAGRTSIPYIGAGRNIYDKEESKYD